VGRVLVRCDCKPKFGRVTQVVDEGNLREVYRDLNGPHLITRSYYLHNKIQILDSNIKEINETIKGLGVTYEGIVRQSEMLISLMKDHPNPTAQHQAYAESLNALALTIREYANGHISDGIKVLAQVKYYNAAMRKRFGNMFWWKHEGLHFRFFRKHSHLEAFNNIDSLDRIDAIIDSEVLKTIQSAEARGNKIKERPSPPTPTAPST
jgi:hypothetical protein